MITAMIMGNRIRTGKHSNIPGGTTHYPTFINLPDSSKFPRDIMISIIPFKFSLLSLAISTATASAVSSQRCPVGTIRSMPLKEKKINCCCSWSSYATSSNKLACNARWWPRAATCWGKMTLYIRYYTNDMWYIYIYKYIYICIYLHNCTYMLP